MKIAQIAPLHERVPPRLYGGTERIVSYLTEQLVADGHEVTLFASGDSLTAAELVACSPTALRLDPAIRDTLPWHVLQLERLRVRAHEFDILHFHTDLLHFPLCAEHAGRSLTTLHGRLDLPDLAPFYAAFPQANLVSISDDQRRPMPPVSWAGTVHHGLPPDLLPYSAAPRGDYLAFLGRISPEKGPEQAIRIATRAGMRLRIAAKVDKADEAYWQQVVRPLVEANPLVEYVGEITEAGKAGFLGEAAALLFPIAWPEPFGLVMIEAMSCGTPVIAYPHGSVPEVIEHGVSGWIVPDEDAAVAAVPQVPALARAGVRAAFERRFTVARMAERYAAIYEALAAGRPAHHLCGTEPRSAAATKLHAAA